MRDTTPLLPWRPAILSPTWIFLFCAMYTRTIWLTPGASSSWFSRVKIFTSTMMPNSPCGTRSEVSRTSRAFSPKMARSRRSSAVSSVSPLGVTLPTRMSPARTSAPMRMMPSLVQVAQRVVADVGNVAGDLLRPQLGVAGLGLVFLDVNGGVDVLLHQALAQQNGVLVVIAFPGHEADQDVAAQRDFAVVGRGAVGDDLALGHDLALVHDAGAG